MDVVSITALVVAVVSVGVAVWQGLLSRKQLSLARETERRTSDALEEVRRVTGETKQLTADVKSNIDERITRILDNKLASEQQSQAASAAMSQALTQQLLGQMFKGSTPPSPPQS